jgi:hypothetical protein
MNKLLMDRGLLDKSHSSQTLSRKFSSHKYPANMAYVATTGGTLATQQDENNYKSPDKKFLTPGSTKN